MGLTDDFAEFLNSPESKKPAFQVREDWREWQYEQALLNGDIYADEHPNRELSDGWFESYELEEEPPQDAETFTALSKKVTDK